jgi:uncharacterized protein (DUF362 family)
LTYADIKALVAEAVALAGGLDGIVKTGDVVVLKPNIVCAYYNWGSTGSAIPMTSNGVGTDWRMIQAVAELVREKIGPYDAGTGKGKILLMEGPATGSNAGHFTVMGWTTSNLTAVNEIIMTDNEGTWVGKGVGTGAQAAYATQVTLDNFVYTGASGAWADYYKNDGKYWVNTKMYNADAFISLPVLKNHNIAGVAGSIKNIGMGAPPPRIYGISNSNVGRNSMVNHASSLLHNWIADYLACLPCDFTIMDGLQGLQNGPDAGASLTALQAKYKNMRCILASNDPLALDIVEANIMNWDYTTVPYMTYLASRGEVGPKPNGRVITLHGDPKDIVVLGNKKVDDVRTNFAGTMQTGNTNITTISTANKTLPTVEIASAAFSGSNLNVELALSNGVYNTVNKIDLYIGGAYKASYNSGMASVGYDASSLSSGSHSIEVRAYQQYMSCATAVTTAVK